MMFSTSRMRQFEMVGAASVGIVSCNSVWRSEPGPAMGFAAADARIFWHIFLGPDSLELTKKCCFCSSFTFGVTVRDESLSMSQIILTVSPSRGKTERVIAVSGVVLRMFQSSLSWRTDRRDTRHEGFFLCRRCQANRPGCPPQATHSHAVRPWKRILQKSNFRQSGPAEHLYKSSETILTIWWQ